MQVLLRAAQQLDLGVVLLVARPCQRPQVGELGEHAVLAGDQRRIARQVDAGAVQVGHDPRRRGGVDVVAEHEPLERVQVLAAEHAHRRVRLGLRGGERHPLARVGRRRAAVERLEPHQRRLGADVDVGGGQHVADPAVERCGQRGLHLHALHDGNDVARLDLVARPHRDGDDHRRRGAAHEAALVARDAVRHAVDLDQ